MCEPVTTGLIISAISSAGGAVNEDQALRRQDAKAAQGIRNQGLIQQQSNNAVDDQINKFGEASVEESNSLEGFLNVLRGSQDSTEGALDPVLAANPRFAERVSGNKEGIATRGREEAGRLSRIDAPIQQRIREANDVTRTQGDLNELGRQSTIEDFLTRLRVSEEQPDAAIGALSKIGQAIGTVMTLGAGSGVTAGAEAGKTAVSTGSRALGGARSVFG